MDRKAREGPQSDHGLIADYKGEEAGDQGLGGEAPGALALEWEL